MGFSDYMSSMNRILYLHADLVMLIIFPQVSDGLTSASASESNVQDNSLVHNQKLAQPRDLGTTNLISS